MAIFGEPILAVKDPLDNRVTRCSNVARAVMSALNNVDDFLQLLENNRALQFDAGQFGPAGPVIGVLEDLFNDMIGGRTTNDREIELLRFIRATIAAIYTPEAIRAGARNRCLPQTAPRLKWYARRGSKTLGKVRVVYRRDPGGNPP